MLTSLQASIKSGENGFQWKCDPFSMLDERGPSLVNTTIERSRTLGNNPNATGKDAGNWKALYQDVKLAYLENLENNI